MKSSLAVICSLLLLAGCAVEKKMATEYSDLLLPKYKAIGEFTLDQGSPSVDQLLSRFRDKVPAAFKAKGLDLARLEKDDGLQWAVLTFEYRFIHWKLGVQFVRAPREVGPRVLALIRTSGTVDGQGPDPEKLDELLPVISDALQLARLP